MVRQNLIGDVLSCVLRVLSCALRLSKVGRALGAFLLITGLFAGGGSAKSLAQAGPGETFSQEQALRERVRRSFHGPDGTGKDGPMAKAGPKLARLYHAFRQHQAEKAAGSFEATQPLMPVVERRHVVIDAVAGADPAALRDSLQALGLRRGSVAGRVVSGLLPIDAIEKMAGLSLLNSAAPSVASSGPPSRRLGSIRQNASRKASAEGRGAAGSQGRVGNQGARTAQIGATTTQVGATTTQGDVALRADQARGRFGTSGSGTKVCALSDSYDGSDNAATTASQDAESGDLPGPGNPNGFTQPVDVLEDYSGGGPLGPASDEGRGMLQIIHDIAPGAELGFHTAAGGLANFVQGIGDLAGAGCQVIVDDILYFAEPMFQDGLVTGAIEEVASEGAAYFTAAGNGGAVSYSRPFSGSGQPASSIGIGGEGDLHDFDPGSGTDVRQQITVQAGRTAVISFQWDDPFFRISGEPGADTDLDLYLLDGEEVVAQGTRDNIGGDPWEVLAYQNSTSQSQTLDLAIVRVEGPAPGRLKHVHNPTGAVTTIDEHDTSSPASYGHFDAGPATSVAASAWFAAPRVPEGSPAGGSDPPLLNGFSSKGGTPLLFNGSGNRLSEPVRREKPDLTAPDVGNTTFFGFDLPDQIDTDDFPNFPGTSAAGPHAAAVAALMLEVRPDLGPGQIRSRLQQSALDVQERVPILLSSPIDERTAIPEGEGDDRFSGAGLIRADQAVESVLSALVTGLEASGEAPGGAPTAPAVLQWHTGFERESEGFIVERRTGPLTQRARQTNDGWQQVDFIPSKASGGSSTDTLQYRFEGQVPTPGQYAFRLRHVTEEGPEGGRRIGAAAQVDIPIGGEVAIGAPRPNPSRGRATAEVVVKEPQQVRAVLYDALGRRVRMVYNEQLEAQTPLLLQVGDGGQLASGTYFLRVRGEEFARTRRMTVVR